MTTAAMALPPVQASAGMPRQRHPVALAAVLAAHALLAAWAWHAHWVDAPAADPEPLLTLTLFLQRAATPAAPAATPAVTARSSLPQRRSNPDTASISTPPLAGPDVGTPVPDAAAQGGQPSLSITPEPAASAPLDLAYHRQPGARSGARNPAVDDPRIGSRTSYGERFAKTLGTDTTMHEEAIDGGRRFRQGTSCTEVHDSRAATLDPYNQSYLPTPKGAKPC